MSDVQTSNTQDVRAVPEVFEEFLPPIPFPVRGKDKNVLNYMINESDGGEDFWHWCTKAAKIESENDKKENAYDVQAELIVQCITLNDKKVPIEVIKGWGMKCKDKAFEFCKKQCGLTGEEREKEKKDLPSGEMSGGGTPSLAGSDSVQLGTPSE